MSKGFLPFTMTQSSWPHTPVSYCINQNYLLFRETVSLKSSFSGSLFKCITLGYSISLVGCYLNTLDVHYKNLKHRLFHLYIFDSIVFFCFFIIGS